MATDSPTIILIHGMWMTPRSWDNWIDHYTDRGYRAIAPGWPGIDKEPEEIRRDPSPLKGLGIEECVEHYDQIIRGLDLPPIIIGHSFGGLFTQLLLDRGLGAAGVAIGTGPPKGVIVLPPSTLRAAVPALHKHAHPGGVRRHLPGAVHPRHEPGLLPGRVRESRPQLTGEGHLQQPVSAAAAAHRRRR